MDEEDSKKDHYAPAKPPPPPTSHAPWASNAQAKQLDPVSIYVFRDIKINKYMLTQRMVPTKVNVISPSFCCVTDLC